MGSILNALCYIIHFICGEILKKKRVKGEIKTRKDCHHSSFFSLMKKFRAPHFMLYLS